MTAAGDNALTPKLGDGSDPRTPLAINNRPGMSSITYRVGTHAAFKASMLERLAVLRGLHTHERSDFTIALVDAFASMAEVLTFYQERIANESYLHTATERRSVLELARLIDYRPRPGVAASTYLAFTLEDAPGSPDQASPPVTIPEGLKVQSLPPPGEPPQVFETADAIQGRPEWNAIQPRRMQEQTLAANMQSIVFTGAAVEVQPGDGLLIAADSKSFMRVLTVSRDLKRGVTRVNLTDDPPDPPPFRPPVLPVGTFFLDRRILTERVVTSRILRFSWRQHDLHALVRMHGWSLPDLTVHIREQAAHRPLPPQHGVFAFRERAALFGHNAPKYGSLAPTLRGPGTAFPDDWDDPGRTLADKAGVREIDLDRSYTGISIGSAVVLEDQFRRHVYRIEDVSELSRADFSMSAKVTRLRLDSDAGFTDFTLRGTSVYLQSEQLELADLPILDPVEGANVILDGAYFGLAIGQTVILTGLRADLEGVVASETLTIADIIFTAGYTTLLFRQALANSYVRDTVTLNANVALATHGETIREVLGSGDAGRPFQDLTLRQSPLTYVSSDASSGAQSTLRLRVGDELWRETPSFYSCRADEHVYVTRRSDDGQTTVEFGDGVSAARPASGVENITATYRKGLGAIGNVDAGRLSLLPVRPLGVRSVNNPTAAMGGTDPEQRDDIRRNAALTTLTLDRIVSLQDYEDFARAFAGVAKAMAAWSWVGSTRAVFLTVSGAGGSALAENDRVYANLLVAIRKAGDPRVPLRVQSYRPAFFRLSATVIVEPDLVAATVLAAVDAKLRDTFSFDARAFGQGVALSEILAAAQSVRGVRAVQADQFFRTDDANGEGLGNVLASASPQTGSRGELLAAELLTLDPRPLRLVGTSP